MEKIAQQLLEKEILFQSDLEKIIGKRPFEKETTYEAFTRKVDEKDQEEAIIKKEAENRANDLLNDMEEKHK